MKDARADHEPRSREGTYSVQEANKTVSRPPRAKPMKRRTTIRKVMLGENAAMTIVMMWMTTNSM